MKIGITFGHGVFPAGDGVRARGWESSRFEGDHLTQIGFRVTLPRIINRRDYIVWHHILKIMSHNDAIKRRNLILENSVVNLPKAQHYEQWCYLCSQLPGVLLLCREIGPKIDTLKNLENNSKLMLYLSIKSADSFLPSAFFGVSSVASW